MYSYVDMHLYCLAEGDANDLGSAIVENVLEVPSSIFRLDQMICSFSNRSWLIGRYVVQNKMRFFAHYEYRFIIV